MKKIITLTCVLLLFMLPAFAQASGLDDVISALRGGNAAQLAKQVDNSIELSLPAKTDNYSRQQAAVILQDFFANNGVKDFEVKHRGDNSDSKYCIGTLITRSGNYRTTFFMMDKGGRQWVKEIRFQKM